jgi:integrase
MLHTAARRGELLRLKWSDVDLERQTIRLSTRKRKSGSLEYDQIPMTGLLKDELKAHWPRARSVYVFCKEDGRPFTERRHLMTRVCRRSNVPYFGFHAIRHLSATMMDQAGVPLRTIQAILRHKSATTTDRYLHSLRGERVELDGVFEGGKGKIIKMGGE